MIDWTLARQVARGVAALPPAGDPAPFERVADPAAESEALVSAYTGLVAAAPVPPPEPVGRPAWIEANLRSLETVLEPAAQRLAGGLGPGGGAVGALLAIEAGAGSGVLPRGVLGPDGVPGPP